MRYDRSHAAFAWVIIAAFLPLGVCAADFGRVLEDIQLFDASLQDDDKILTDHAEDASVWDTSELFPSTGSGSSLPESTGTHLTIKVDGVPVVLSDVPSQEWFAPYIRDVSERGVISGYRSQDGRPTGLFGPADSVTIEQLAKMAVQSAAIDIFGCGDTLKNVIAPGRWSERYIRCAEANGWAVFSDGSVDPARPATRAEVVVTVLQAFKARIPPRSGTLFTDVTTATVYGAAIEAAANDKIVSGYSDDTGRPTGEFGPEDAVNRAQTAKIISLSFQVYAP